MKAVDLGADQGSGHSDTMVKKEDKKLQPEGSHDAQTGQKAPHAALPAEAQGRIGQHLRRIYGEILEEPLPDKFSQLLDNLAKTERSE